MLKLANVIIYSNTNSWLTKYIDWFGWFVILLVSNLLHSQFHVCRWSLGNDKQIILDFINIVARPNVEHVWKYFEIFLKTSMDSYVHDTFHPFWFSSLLFKSFMLLCESWKYCHNCYLKCKKSWNVAWKGYVKCKSICISVLHLFKRQMPK